MLEIANTRLSDLLAATEPFSVHARDGAARTATLRLGRGEVRTPAFMPVGTAGTVKAMYADQVRATGADIVLGNTYHLMLRPGAERVAALGGLHAMMRWPHPILTDSGGFQVMSLASLRKLDRDGVTFRSHIDGSEHRLTPERSVEIQRLLGADITMQLDECIRLPAERAEVERAMRLSLDWAERSKAAFGEQPGRALFGIVQGGTDAELRRLSAERLVGIGFDGYALGGLAVGEPQDEMLATIEATVPFLPEDRPRYLMGVGTPDDILQSISRGIDMFDCVMPTRAGRHGLAYTRFGRINLKNAVHADDAAPLDPESACPAARDYSRAYLHHLVKAGEILGMMLLTWNNLDYYQRLVEGARAAIAEGRLADYVAATSAGWQGERCGVSFGSFVAIYFVIWWIALFAVLPWGIRSQAEEGEVVPGTDPGAPRRPRFLFVILVTTALSAVVFAIFYGIISQDFISLEDLDWLPGAAA